MPRIIPAQIEIQDQRGAIATVNSGSFSEFPAWFIEELLAIVKRLNKEAQAQADAAAVDPNATKQSA